MNAFFPRPLVATVLSAACMMGVGLVPCVARAEDSTIKNPGEHPDYTVELEPHLGLGVENLYNTNGLGLGGRVGIPIVKNGFVPTINNSVAISLGLDLLYFSDCERAYRNCSATVLSLPATMQWNFYVAKQWTVFGEPGFAIRKGWVNCPDNEPCSNRGTNLAWIPALYLGGRYHFNEHVALTMRIGYPAFSIGASFF